MPSVPFVIPESFDLAPFEFNEAAKQVEELHRELCEHFYFNMFPSWFPDLWVETMHEGAD